SLGAPTLRAPIAGWVFHGRGPGKSPFGAAALDGMPGGRQRYGGSTAVRENSIMRRSAGRLSAGLAASLLIAAALPAVAQAPGPGQPSSPPASAQPPAAQPPAV